MAQNNSDDVNITNLKIEVGILKNQISNLTQLCQKMDNVIDRIVTQQDKYMTHIHQEMENKRLEKKQEFKEVHDRIDDVMINVRETEDKIMKEIRQLRSEIETRNEKEQLAIAKLDQWKWTILGGIIVTGWLLSHANYDIISKLFH